MKLANIMSREGAGTEVPPPISASRRRVRCDPLKAHMISEELSKHDSITAQVFMNAAEADL